MLVFIHISEYLCDFQYIYFFFVFGGEIVEFSSLSRPEIESGWLRSLMQPLIKSVKITRTPQYLDPIIAKYTEILTPLFTRRNLKYALPQLMCKIDSICWIYAQTFEIFAVYVGMKWNTVKKSEVLSAFWKCSKSN